MGGARRLDTEHVCIECQISGQVPLTEEHADGSHASAVHAHAGQHRQGDRRLLCASRAGSRRAVRRSGTAVKLAYKTVNTFMPGHVRFMVESLLPEMVDKLEPFWIDFQESGGGEFGDYLAKRAGEVSQALLSVTDARAVASGRPVIIKAYGSVRNSAAKHVESALPRVGELVQKHAS